MRRLRQRASQHAAAEHANLYVLQFISSPSSVNRSRDDARDPRSARNHRFVTARSTCSLKMSCTASEKASASLVGKAPLDRHARAARIGDDEFAGIVAVEFAAASASVVRFKISTPRRQPSSWSAFRRGLLARRHLAAGDGCHIAGREQRGRSAFRSARIEAGFASRAASVVRLSRRTRNLVPRSMTR